jgi:hypothetical protein
MLPHLVKRGASLRKELELLGESHSPVKCIGGWILNVQIKCKKSEGWSKLGVLETGWFWG